MSDEIKDKLKNLFSAPQITENKEVITNITVKTEDQKEVDDTHQYVEKELMNLVEMAKSVVEEAATVAKSTGEPEHFKAFSMVMKETGKVTSEILHILKLKKAMEVQASKPEQPDDINPVSKSTTNVFINGTLNEVMKKLKDEDKVIDVKPIQEE